MGLFKSEGERRAERELKIRRGIKSIEKAVREQGKFAQEFTLAARQARKVGDEGQYRFVRSALKRTEALRRTLERQLMVVKNAQLLQKQARASAEFSAAMGVMAKEIGKAFGETDLIRTQADWTRAVEQAGSMEERMDLLLDGMQEDGTSSTPVSEGTVSDDEIDRMIDADVAAEEQQELSELEQLDAEIARELGEK